MSSMKSAQWEVYLEIQQDSSTACEIQYSNYVLMRLFSSIMQFYEIIMCFLVAILRKNG